MKILKNEYVIITYGLTEDIVGLYRAKRDIDKSGFSPYNSPYNAIDKYVQELVNDGYLEEVEYSEWWL